MAAKLKTSGKAPWMSLGSRLYVDVRDNAQSRFVKIGKRPARFFLVVRQAELAPDIITKIEDREAKAGPGKVQYRERDLHPLLAYFAYANPSFSRGRSIHTKTIRHEESSRPGYNEWAHPDMVGFYLPAGGLAPPT